MITGKDLRLLRLSSGQTQAQIAEKLGQGGYDAKVIGSIENGRRNIGLALLSSWASACGYDVKIEFVKSGSNPDDEILEVDLPDNFNEYL